MMDVVLVDENDKELGLEEKLEAHKKGKLHRAFSVFVFNSKKELLMQKRASEKYHSSGVWTNTCCSHPGKGEDVKKEAEKRLKEEMGFSCNLEKKFGFIYRAVLDNSFIEHEYDYVFFGKYDKNPNPNKSEVDDWRWVSLKELKRDIEKNPKKYSPWLRIIIDDVASLIT
jgi:isopentenyl-diphosphate delta-isomerase